MAHSSHVTKVKFTGDDKQVISTGGNDKTIFVWETKDFGNFDMQKSKLLKMDESEIEDY
jgi:WD40 repeat protein